MKTFQIQPYNSLGQTATSVGWSLPYVFGADKQTLNVVLMNNQTQVTGGEISLTNEQCDQWVDDQYINDLICSTWGLTQVSDQEQVSELVTAKKGKNGK